MPALIALVLDVAPLTPSELRWEFAGVAIGFILLSVGLAAIAVFPFRRSSDLTLVYFGSASIFYALRVLFGERMIRLVFPIENSVWNHLILLIDCFIAVPFTLFLTQIVEPRWKNTIRWLVAVQLAFGFVRLAFTLLKIGEKAVKVGNNVFIIFFCVLICLWIWTNSSCATPEPAILLCLSRRATRISRNPRAAKSKKTARCSASFQRRRIVPSKFSSMPATAFSSTQMESWKS